MRIDREVQKISRRVIRTLRWLEHLEVGIDDAVAPLTARPEAFPLGDIYEPYLPPPATWVQHQRQSAALCLASGHAVRAVGAVWPLASGAEGSRGHASGVRAPKCRLFFLSASLLSCRRRGRQS